MDHKYEGKNLIFSGDFKNIGKLEIDCDNVTITGLDSNLKNTVFKLTGNQITLKDLNFNLDTSIKENNGAGIFVVGNDITLVNLTIDYIAPKDVEAYAIYSDAYTYGAIENLKIINSTIYFEGHNDNVRKYNCALKLTYAYDSIIENNTIITSLPLKNINYASRDATLDSAYVCSVGVEGCGGLIFNNNTIISDVNKRTAVEYPTLDGLIISKSDNVVISNNSIYMTDFVTYQGIDNYLYGIDIHNLNNLWVVNNSISIITTGGKLAAGTAYPIQISGPIQGVNIEYNDLYSFSNGPNIGIYSQCSYGETYLSIKYNKINVTGLAGTHEWALVTGIESQDTYAEILNNQIEVHSVADVGINDHLYAISYSQTIDGPNTFDIENNVAITDGYYAVYLLSSDQSSIINNTLISFNDNVKTGDYSYSEGFRHHNGDEHHDNYVIRAVDYYSVINKVDNGNIIEIGESTTSNVINTNSILPKSQQDNVANNPLVPGFKDLSGINWDNSNGYNGYIDDGSTQGTIGSANYNHDSQSENSNSKISNTESEIYSASSGNSNVTTIDGNSIKVISNSSSSSSIGISNNPLTGSQASTSAGASKSVSKKAYEIEEMIKKEDFIPSIFIVIFVLLLLIIGYKRKSEEIN